MASRPRGPPRPRGVAAPWSRRLAVGVWTACFILVSRSYGLFLTLDGSLIPWFLKESWGQQGTKLAEGCSLLRRLPPALSLTTHATVTLPRRRRAQPPRTPGQEPVQFRAALGEQGRRVRPFHLKMRAQLSRGRLRTIRGSEAASGWLWGSRRGPAGLASNGSSQHSEPAGCRVPLSES